MNKKSFSTNDVIIYFFAGMGIIGILYSIANILIFLDARDAQVFYFGFLLSVLIFVISLLCFLVSWGAKRHKKWAKILGMSIMILPMLAFVITSILSFSLFGLILSLLLITILYLLFTDPTINQ